MNAPKKTDQRIDSLKSQKIIEMKFKQLTHNQRLETDYDRNQFFFIKYKLGTSIQHPK